MHILILSQEPPFDAAQVATGNALRTHQLHSALGHAGHTVQQAWLSLEGGAQCFRSADELRGLMQRSAPDVILVSYWELLELLPFSPPVPVLLDFLAPRPLEVLFEEPGKVGGMLRRLRVALARCDLLLVGNTEQEKLLSFWLLEAGFDLREGSPVRVVGLAGAPVPRAEPDPAQDPAAGPAAKRPLRLVSGGVSWPWRDDQSYRDALDSAMHRLDPEQRELQCSTFAGSYRWHDDERAASRSPADKGADTADEQHSEEADRHTAPVAPAETPRALAAYADWSAFLGTAHIGLELGSDHIERRFSQSFRSLDFLRHGLPLLCSAGQPVAEQVKAYGAGWVVDAPEELEPILAGLMAQPQAWQAASEAATRLVREQYDPEQAIKPLLEWLQAPARARRLPGYGVPDPDPPVLGKPPMRERLARRYRLARRIALHRLLRAGRQNTRSPDQHKPIVIVSREDLFPTDHGAAVKVVETARGLSRNGPDVFLVTHDRRHYWRFTDGAVAQCRLPRWLGLLGRPLPLVKLQHYTLDIPESNAFLYLPLSDGTFFWRVLWVAAQHQAGALQAEFPAYALPCQQVGEVLDLPTVLVEHNVEFDRLRAQVPELTDAQYERFRDIEIHLCNRSEAVVCVSDNDRQRLAEAGVHPGRLHTIPHGIDLSSFDESEPAAARERFGIPDQALLLVYHGTFAYPPNRDALLMLAEEILPRLDARGQEAHVLAVGHQPPPELHPRIHFTGSVEHVAPWLKAADIAVVPLREGGGTRMKIIDDFAARLPVVATAKGIEGIPAADGFEALIRDDWDGFADAVALLAEDAERRQALADAGRKLADELDWQAIGARYLKLVGALSRGG